MEVDGRAVAETSEAPLEMPTGRHFVVARRAGYQPLAREVTLTVEGPNEIDLELAVANEELLAQQVALLRRDGDLRPDELDHLALVTSATGADLVVLVEPSGEMSLIDSAGDQVPWPEVPTEDPEDVEGEGEPPPPPPTPVWRRWWFWVTLVGGAAVLATGVGVGVYYGTRPDYLTITIVPGE